MAPLVSIIIPCLNAEATIERCLASCFRQTYPVLEILIVDNGSVDATVERAERAERAAHHHGRPVAVARCPDRGVNRARNHGYTVSRGDYVQWLDADDELHPEKISLQVAALERHPEHAIAYGDWRWRFPLPGGDYRRAASGIMQSAYAAAYGERRWILVEGSPRFLERRFALRQHDDFLLRLLQDMWLPPHAYLLRRGIAQALHENLAFHPDTRVATDREYFSVAALLGARFLHVPGAKADYYTWSGTQITQSHTLAERAAQLSLIFARLREFAERNPTLRLGAGHRLLLAQSWDLHFYALAESGERPARSPRRSGPDDVLMRRALSADRASLPLELHAKRIAHGVPSLWERHLRIMRVLQRLAACGSMRCDLKV